MLLSRQDVLRSQDLGVGRSSGTLGILSLERRPACGPHGPIWMRDTLD